jgi:hypothetical protein
MKVFLMSIALVAVFAAPAYADKRTANPASMENCPMQENANVGFNFNSNTSDLDKIKGVMDQKIDEAQAMAKEAGVEKAELQNYNFSIYSNASSGCDGGGSGAGMFNYNGSANFVVTPGDKADEFMTMLQKKGFQANMNVNAYRQCQ